MHWRSRIARSEKASAPSCCCSPPPSLLLRGGERVRLLGGPTRRTGPAAARSTASPPRSPRLPDGEGLPPDAPLPRHAHVVLIGDFLSPLAGDPGRGRRGSPPSRCTGHLLQILDPAEALLPYSGRVRFRGSDGRSRR